MIEVRVPDEQEGTKAVVRAWLRQIGDAVAENDPLVELETDKVTQEVPAPAAGVLAEILLDTDAEAVGIAKDRGLTFIITDHHDLPADLQGLTPGVDPIAGMDAATAGQNSVRRADVPVSCQQQ